MNYSSMILSASKATTFNPGGFDMERIEDGIMHQELKDSLLCGICLGIYSEFLILYVTYTYLFRVTQRSHGV